MIHLRITLSEKEIIKPIEGFVRDFNFKVPNKTFNFLLLNNHYVLKKSKLDALFSVLTYLKFDQ
ncbi:hypothetical protein [Borrelia venezuelensis]|uniref:hypothetical protein n=1 Tax=Borrelia venezuelensis TaxID=1653839 RepID=UPI001FF5EBB1|nr:hypothetical protein [Borrelia venezuelensis]UPA12738.1 hypothetical protein bvRMA01_001074 [Borrelia venezuelensis]